MNDDFSAFTSSPNGASSSSSSVPSSSSHETAPENSSRFHAQQTRRVAFLDNLQRNLDIVIYCQLSILYYMDCSLLRFFIRAFPHWILFTPKPPFFPGPPSNRPYVSSIVLGNGFCALAHLLGSRPEAGEITRGYLHGGLLIDFVGELGPISRWRMLLVDVFIMLLQLVILGVMLERRDLKSAISNPSAMASSRGAGQSAVASPSRQDIDAEEQGIRRSQENLEDDIELAALDKDGTKHDSLANLRRKDDHALDMFYSGQVVIVDIHFTDAIRTAWCRRYEG